MGYLVDLELWDTVEEDKFDYYHKDLKKKYHVGSDYFDYFAMCLLMPKLEFFSKMHHYTEADHSIDLRGLSEYFSVPINRVKDRIYSLGYSLS